MLPCWERYIALYVSLHVYIVHGKPNLTGLFPSRYMHVRQAINMHRHKQFVNDGMVDDKVFASDIFPIFSSGISLRSLRISFSMFLIARGATLGCLDSGATHRLAQVHCKT